jgi:hypothetical protein
MKMNKSMLIGHGIDIFQTDGGLKPMRAQRMSISALKVSATGTAAKTIFKCCMTVKLVQENYKSGIKKLFGAKLAQRAGVGHLVPPCQILTNS